MNANDQAATTTSVSNKEYSTFLPLGIVGEKSSDDGPGVFANPFSDEVEAASLRGFFLQESNKRSNSCEGSNQYLEHANGAISDQSVHTQSQMYTTHQDPAPARPLHFKNSEPMPGLTQLNASSFVFGEIPSISSNHSVISEISYLPSTSHKGNPGQLHGPFHVHDEQSVVSSHRDGKQVGIFHTQHPASVSSYHNQYAGNNIPSTVSTTSGSTHQSNPSYIAMKPSIAVRQIELQTNLKSSKRKSTSNSKVNQVSGDEAQEIRRRRKHERNLREQQRSHRITEQITELRKVMVDTASIRFKKTDKYSVLCKAVDHIRELQVSETY